MRVGHLPEFHGLRVGRVQMSFSPKRRVFSLASFARVLRVHMVNVSEIVCWERFRIARAQQLR
eukprot:3349015-Pyramimonas_sp.AAC.1